MESDLDLLVRRVDEDRWLASRFAPRDLRARLIALYALNYEIARTAESVSEPGLGDIRLAWWREGVAEIYAGGPVRAQPALTAYAKLARAQELPRAPLDALIEARAKDFEAQPFATWAELETYVDATAGSVLRLALAICGAAGEDVARAGGRAWGYAGLLRAEPFWTARGRSFLPRAGGDASGLRARAEDAHRDARRAAAKLPANAFPAAGYLSLTPLYLRALKRGASVALWSRQWRLVFASATGLL